MSATSIAEWVPPIGLPVTIADAGEDRRHRLDLDWTLVLEEATHGHPRWRPNDSAS